MCAAIKDEAWGSSKWRGKGKTKRKVSAQIKAEKENKE
jgi:hypothetical protein